MTFFASSVKRHETSALCTHALPNCSAAASQPGLVTSSCVIANSRQMARLGSAEKPANYESISTSSSSVRDVPGNLCHIWTSISWMLGEQVAKRR